MSPEFRPAMNFISRRFRRPYWLYRSAPATVAVTSGDHPVWPRNSSRTATASSRVAASSEAADRLTEKNPDGTGLGNHPAVMKFLNRIGKALADPDFQTGEEPPSDTDTLKRMYPSMYKDEAA